MADVNIKINVDTTNATGKISDVRQELAQTAVAAQKADSSLGNISTKSKTAATAMTGLGNAAKSVAVGVADAAVATEGASVAMTIFEGVLTGGLSIAITAIVGLLVAFGTGLLKSEEDAQSLSTQLDNMSIDLDNATASFSRFNKEAAATKALRDINLKNLGLDPKDLIGTKSGFDKQDAGEVLRQLQATETLLKSESAEVYAKALSAGSKELHDILVTTTDLSEVKKKMSGNDKDDNELIDKALKVYQQLLNVQSEITVERTKVRQISSQEVLDLKKINDEEAKRVGHIKAQKVEKDSFIKHPHFDLYELTSSDQAQKNYEKQIQAENKAIQETLKKFPIQIPWALKIEEKQIDEQAQMISEAIAYSMGNALQGIGEAIGKGISGGGNVLASIFEGVLHTMGAFISQLGKMAIATGTLALALKNVFKNPFTSILAGIAGVAIGTVLQNIKLPAFADGVTNFGGGMAIVGERGPELVRLPRGSDVIPNHLIGDVGMGQQIYIPTITLRGQDLVLAFNRASATLNRNG